MPELGYRGKPWTTRALLTAKRQGAVIRVNTPDSDEYNMRVVHDPEGP